MNFIEAVNKLNSGKRSGEDYIFPAGKETDLKIYLKRLYDGTLHLEYFGDTSLINSKIWKCYKKYLTFSEAMLLMNKEKIEIRSINWGIGVSIRYDSEKKYLFQDEPVYEKSHYEIREEDINSYWVRQPRYSRKTDEVY